MSEQGVTDIARCAEHGLHGDRAECFVCGGPVEQVAMVEASVAEERHVQRMAPAIERAADMEARAIAGEALLEDVLAFEGLRHRVEWGIANTRTRELVRRADALRGESSDLILPTVGREVTSTQETRLDPVHAEDTPAICDIPSLDESSDPASPGAPSGAGGDQGAESYSGRRTARRRVAMPLSGGGELHVSLHGEPSPEAVAALRQVGEAALKLMRGEP